MSNLSEYVNHFFNDLEVFEDCVKGHSFKTYIHQAVLEFLASESKKTAFTVYEAFFDSYRIQLPGETNPFIDLLDMLRNYEENAATLIDKQRDHFIHSVNVFILGLCIYSQNSKYQAAFDNKIMKKTDYPFSYDTLHEEFFYRWGIASLFHDVGYPLEIIGNQITKFINFTTTIDNKTTVKSHIEFSNFDDFNSIAEILPKQEFTDFYCKKFNGCVGINLLKPIDLLAHKLHISLDLNLQEVKASLDNFISVMADYGFIDHGFFSAIIILRWYGFLIQSCKYKPAYFFFPILDSASAILLHNFFKNVIMKPPFSSPSLSPFDHPIAFLLILCDELQEWSREAYGILSKKHLQPGKARIFIGKDKLNVKYLSRIGKLPDKFACDKEETINNILNMKALFPKGITIKCEVLNELTSVEKESVQGLSVSPRPKLEIIEKIAIAIHDLYNLKQHKQYPDRPLSHPHFSDLPEALKYSNLRQARSIWDKVNLLGWEVHPKNYQGEKVDNIPENLVEFLAIVEHEEWQQERIRSGYVFGKFKDDVRKTSPYLVPYNELSEDIKEYDRVAVRNIPKLLGVVGFALYRNNLKQT